MIRVALSQNSSFHPASPAPHHKPRKTPQSSILFATLLVFASSFFVRLPEGAVRGATGRPQTSVSDLGQKNSNTVLAQNKLASLPARFEPNRGQIDPYFAYLARTYQYHAAIAKNKIVFALPGVSGKVGSPVDAAGGKVQESFSKDFAGSSTDAGSRQFLSMQF